MRLADYWATDYDWRAREEALNRFDHYTTEIDGLDIHFIHQRSGREDAFPLLITHGWPGSIVEFHKVIEPLTERGFDVVCPSLPGYGFSGKPTSTGWGIEKIAAAWDTLMGRLGYERFGAQGGDWGAAVTTQIGRNGGRCAAIHVNMPLGFPAGNLDNPTDEEKAALEAGKHYADWDSGYSKQQSTRPQTLGYGLVDSPVGQLAWIVEKFWSWTDCDGHPENVLTKDEMLDNVMLYWLTASGASSARLYWESFNFFGGVRPCRTANRYRVVSEGDPQGAAQMVRGRLQHHPLDRRCRAAATSRRSSSRSCSSTTSPRSSIRCARWARTIEADYLVVGAGAMGLAFTDTLVSESDATVVVVDRNDQPGGHWTTAYPFVRLHQPSAYYGVNSRDLGSDTIDRDRLQRGLLRAGQRRGGVRLLRRGDAAAAVADGPGDLPADERVPRRRPGPHARRRRDPGDRAPRRHRRHVEIIVPSMRRPSYDVAPGVGCVPPNDLPASASPATAT